MDSEGYLKLDRNIRQWWAWHDKPFSRFQAWIDLLLRAAWRKHKVRYQGQVVGIERGQLCRSLRQLAADWGWSPMKVSRFLENMEKNGTLTRHQTRHHITVITLLNYEKYQSPENHRDAPCSEIETTARQPRDNHETREKKVNTKKGSKEEKGYAPSSVPIPEILDTKPFKAAWESWLTYRRTERRPAVTAAGAKRQLSKLAKAGEMASIAAIENAMRNGYLGLHPKATARKPDDGFDEKYRGVGTRVEV